MSLCGNCFREKNTVGPCPVCGYDDSRDAACHPQALRPGSILNGRYVVGRVIGQGGFGITYLALDEPTGSPVAIKEYYPAEFAGRTADGLTISIHSEERAEDFAYGKAQFLEEAKTLAAVGGDVHIVRIYNYFEENGTAYFTMEYVQGLPLDKYLTARGGCLSTAEADGLLLPLMQALSAVHSRGVVHRDIAPDNIIITRDGVAKLIDFGAARYSTGEKSKSLDVILKHGFAPREQYTRRGRQGPWTDVYALAATYYYAITGKVPPDAIDRMEVDTLQPPHSLGVEITPAQEAALSKGLATMAADRWQNMAEFRMALQEAALAAEAERMAREKKAREEAARRAKAEAERAEHERRKAEKAAEAERRRAEREAAKQAKKTQAPGAADAPPKKPTAILPILIAVVALVLAAVFFWWLSGRDLPDHPLSHDPAVTTEPEPTPEPTLESHIEWNLDEAAGTLTVSGYGEMADAPWSADRDTIRTVIIEDGVTGIGSNAFYGCANLSQITIPDSVTSIGRYAFSGCTSLESIYIPESVTEIEAHTFSRCTALSDVTIPDSVTDIRKFAFYGCSRLTGVSLPDSLRSINLNAFSECSALSDITIPGSVASIGDSAFSNCTALSSVTVLAGVTNISDGAFYGCTALSRVTISDGVASIGKYAFQGCTGLSSVIIPESVTTIGNYAFDGCSAIQDVMFIGTEESWGSVSVGAGNRDLSMHIRFVQPGVTWSLDGGTLTISGYGDMEDYKQFETPWKPEQKEIRSVIIEPGVTGIGAWAFQSCANLSSITIPDSVTSIGNYAFYHCSNLSRITIPESITEIAAHAFSYCSRLSSVTIPDSVTTIGDYAFFKCDRLTSVTLPDSVTSIGTNAFYMSGLRSITIPGSVTDIENQAFYGCTDLSDVYFTGTEAQWAAIRIGSDNEALTVATIHFGA